MALEYSDLARCHSQGLRDLRSTLKRFILPPRRPERSYPRVVKIKMSNYNRKPRSTDKALAN